MSEMDKSYQILGLNPGASEEEIREAYRDLVKVWHPDRFVDNPRLQEKANEKLREINDAYQKLKSYIAGEAEQYTTSDRESDRESKPPPHEPPPKADKEQYTTSADESYGGFQPPPKQPFEQPPPYESPKPQEKQTISHSPLMWAYMLLFGAAIGDLVTRNIHFPTPGSAFIFKGGIHAILAFAGASIGIVIGKKINGMKKTKRTKIKWAWAAGIACLPLYCLIAFLFLSIVQSLSGEQGSRKIDLSFLPDQPKHERYVFEDKPKSSLPGQLEQYRVKREGLEKYRVDEKTGLTAMDWYNKGQSLQQSGNYKEAIDAFTKTIELDSSDPKSYGMRAFALLQIGDNHQAIRDLDKVLELSPSKDAQAFAYGNRGFAFGNLGDHWRAISDFDMAIRLKPDDAWAYYNRGAAYSSVGSSKQAIEDFKIAAKLGSPDAREILRRLQISITTSPPRQKVRIGEGEWIDVPEDYWKQKESVIPKKDVSPPSQSQPQLETTPQEKWGKLRENTVKPKLFVKIKKFKFHTSGYWGCIEVEGTIENRGNMPISSPEIVLNIYDETGEELITKDSTYPFADPSGSDLLQPGVPRSFAHTKVWVPKDQTMKYGINVKDYPFEVKYPND